MNEVPPKLCDQALAKPLSRDFANPTAADRGRMRQTKAH
jgi:hypothetical protein